MSAAAAKILAPVTRYAPGYTVRLVRREVIRRAAGVPYGARRLQSEKREDPPHALDRMYRENSIF